MLVIRSTPRMQRLAHVKGSCRNVGMNIGAGDWAINTSQPLRSGAFPIW
jgi:hypothetical protein